MAKMKYWNGSAWVILDAKDADTLDGKHASNFANSKHEHAAAEVKFTDGKTFQQKLDDGSLKGPKGDKGADGAKGATGATGAKGADGLTTKVVVNGNTYNHSNGTITLPNYPTSLPANGGNADTVDGKHASDFAEKNLAILKNSKGQVPDNITFAGIRNLEWDAGRADGARSKLYWDASPDKDYGVNLQVAGKHNMLFEKDRKPKVFHEDAWKELTTDYITDGLMKKRIIIQQTNIIDYFKKQDVLAGIYYIHANCTGQPTPNYYIADFQRSPVGADFTLRLSEYLTGREFATSCWNGEVYPWKELTTNNNIVNPNILINGEFTIWQRTNTSGKTLSWREYGPDRWCAVHHNNTKIDDLFGMKAPYTMKYGSTIKTERASIGQIIDCLYEGRLIPGQKYTASVYVDHFLDINDNPVQESSGDLYIQNSFNSTAGDVANIALRALSLGLNYITFTMPTNCRYLIFALDSHENRQVALRYAKLEAGETPTPHIVENKALELAKCKRYFINPAYGEGCADGQWNVGHYINGGGFQLLIPTGGMRANPTAIPCLSGKLSVFLGHWVELDISYTRSLSTHVLVQYDSKPIDNITPLGSSLLCNKAPWLDAEIR